LDFKLTLLSYFLSCFEFFSLILFFDFSKTLLFCLFFFSFFSHSSCSLFFFSARSFSSFSFTLCILSSRNLSCFSCALFYCSLSLSLSLCLLKSKSKLFLKKSFSSLENLTRFWMNASPMSMKSSILDCCSLVILNQRGMKCFHIHVFNSENVLMHDSLPFFTLYYLSCHHSDARPTNLEVTCLRISN